MTAICGRAAYDDAFYDTIGAGSASSAAVVVPLLTGLYEPRSVLDVGCGSGDWLQQFRHAGVADLVGIDGGAAAQDRVAPFDGEFLYADLMEPLPTARDFDLVLCLEVAEHLPERRAASLIDELCALGRRVAFSAAIPGQGGTDHVNEQWQSYWAAHFARHGLMPTDSIRPRVWSDARVEPWYRQNLLIYEPPGPRTDDSLLDVVHPDMYNAMQQRAEGYAPTLRSLRAELPQAIRRSAAFRLARAKVRLATLRGAG